MALEGNRKGKRKKWGREVRRQRGKEVVSPAIPPSRPWPGPLGPAVVASRRQEFEDCLLAGFSFSLLFSLLLLLGLW